LDGLSSEAIASLKTTLTDLLSSVTNADVQRQITVLPVHIHPIGLGGFLSVHTEPIGVIEGRHLEAIALINLQSQNVIALNEIASTISTTLIGQTRADLLSQGLLSLKLESPGSLLQTRLSETEEILQKELTFRVLYEFRKLPVESEGVILEVPINLNVG
jgi:hypothetical protein